MTNVKTVYDMALTTIQDYKLERTNQEALLEFLRGKLISGIPEFSGCLDSLEIHKEDVTTVDENGNSNTQEEWLFSRDLSQDEISILAKIIVYKWFLQQHQDVRILMPHLTIKEFKQTDISNGLKQRSEYLDKLKEDINFDITQYQLKNLSKLKFFGGA